MNTKIKYLLVAIFIMFCLLCLTYRQMCKEKTTNKEKTETTLTGSIDFERSKKFSAIRILSVSDTLLAVDAFGEKLKINEWYVQSNVTHVVFPINPKSRNYTKLDWMMEGGEKKLTQAKITNGSPVDIYVEAEILILGKWEIVLNDLEKYQMVFLK